MLAHERNILLTIIYKGESYPVGTYKNEYGNLMSLIADHLAIDGFGLCCGMGSCGTCLVNVGNKHTLIPTPVLACDIQIDDGLSNMQITVPDQRF